MICENCGKPILHPHLSHQRFCCIACSNDWFQAERREALDWFRACGLRPTRGEQQQRERPG